MGLTNIAENGGRGLTGPTGATGPDIAGLASDGQNGAIVDRGLRVGNPATPATPDYLWVRGAVEIDDTAASNTDGDATLTVNQLTAVPAGGNAFVAIHVDRSGDISLGDYQDAAILVEDNTASVAPVVRIKKQGAELLTLGVKPSIAGALSTVTDPAAKAVLTSIIAALTAIKVATDGTT